MEEPCVYETLVELVRKQWLDCTVKELPGQTGSEQCMKADGEKQPIVSRVVLRAGVGGGVPASYSEVQRMQRLDTARCGGDAAEVHGRHLSLK